MTSHIQLVENGRLIGLDGRPWAATPVNAWAGFPCEVHRHMRRGEVADRHNPHPLIFVRYDARGRSRIVSGSRVYELEIAPLQVDVFPAGFRMDHGWWDCTPGALVSIALHGGVLAGDDGLPPLRTTLCGVDETLARVVDCIRREIEGGCPSGSLFAEGLSFAIVARLRAVHVDGADRIAARRIDRLPDGVRRRIVDYVEAHLGADLRIAALADVAGLPGTRFVRAFRCTFGVTPHRYVVQRRLEAAKTMLMTTARPLSDVAYSLGFSSQAHFTATFRRHCGVTPGRVRRTE